MSEQTDTPRIPGADATTIINQEVYQHNIGRLTELVNNELHSRREWLSRLVGGGRDSQNVLTQCHYPDDYPTSEDYVKMYDHEPIPAKIVNLMPKETWRVSPKVYEDEDPTAETDFERDVKDLPKQLRGESSWFEDEEGNYLLSIFQRADELAGIGQYGVMFLGFDDGLDYSLPVKGFVETGSKPNSSDPGPWGTTPFIAPYKMTTNVKTAPDGSPVLNTAGQLVLRTDNLDPTTGKIARDKRLKLMYIRCFPEHLAMIQSVETNQASPRFGQPTMYRITFNDPSTHNVGYNIPRTSLSVHWSRCIHITDNPGTSEVFGVPRMQRVYRRLLDLQKLYGGSAQMYWQGALPGLSFETHPSLGGDVKFDETKLKEMARDYVDGLDRVLLSFGFSVKSLSPQVVDPNPQIQAQLEALAIYLDCPMRILKGSERGELASSQDDDRWNDVVRGRQYRFNTPSIVVPFYDRLILLQCISKPKEKWRIWFPPMDVTSDADKASRAVKLTQALAQFVQSGSEAAMTLRNFLVNVMGFDEDLTKQMIEDLETTEPIVLGKMNDVMLSSDRSNVTGEPGEPASGPALKDKTDRTAGKGKPAPGDTGGSRTNVPKISTPPAK